MRQAGAGDDHRGDRHIAKGAVIGGGHGLDFVHHLHAADHMAEDGVTVGVGLGCIQAVVVGHIDEKLVGGRIGRHGAGHGDGAAFVFQVRACFQGNGGVGGFFVEGGGVAPALDHETIDDPVKHGAVVGAFFDVLNKVRHGFGGLLGFQGQHDVALAGAQLDHDFMVGIGLGPALEGAEQAQGEQGGDQ